MKYARRLPLAKLYNARDLGGFSVPGGVTRFGVFIRSEAPCELPVSDLDSLREYGVTTSLDLRSAFEAYERPSSLLDVTDYHHKSLFNDGVVYDPKRDRGSRPDGPPPPAPGGEKKHDWGVMYRSMAEEARDWAVEVLELAANCKGAMLYHCTTGKDRTGLLTCYLLSIAGVPREDIIADYMVSQVYLLPVYRRMIERSGGIFGTDISAPFFQTPPAAMTALLDYLEETYGGVLPFLREIGVREETIARIRAKLVEEE